MYFDFRYSIEVDGIIYSRAYVVQQFFTYLIPALGIARFVLQIYLFKDGNIYGYMVTFSRICNLNLVSNKINIIIVLDSVFNNYSSNVSSIFIFDGTRAKIFIAIGGTTRTWICPFDILDVHFHFGKFVFCKHQKGRMVVASEKVIFDLHYSSVFDKLQ